MKNELKRLGLTENEASVYEALLGLGEVQVGPIVSRLNIHRQVIYDALAGLEEKNMVIKTSKNGKNQYRVANPKNILENIKHQEVLAENLILEIGKKIKSKSSEQEIRIIEGGKALRDLYLKNDEISAEGSEIKVITSANRQWEDVLLVDNTIDKLNKKRKKKNIQVKVIAEEKDREDQGRVLKANTEVRFINNLQGLPIEVSIWEDCVVLISFGFDVFAIQVKNKKFRDTYLNYFEKLWSSAKE